MEMHVWQALLDTIPKSKGVHWKMSFVSQPKLTKVIEPTRLVISYGDRAVEAIFDKPVNLTIFQAELLIALFAHNRLHSEYAGYHKCIAGQRFIKNLVHVRALPHHCPTCGQEVVQ